MTPRKAAGAKALAPWNASQWEQWTQETGGLLASRTIRLPTLLAVVRETQALVIRHLEDVQPSGVDLSNPDYGIVYYLFYKDGMKGRDLAALRLLRRCLAILERGDLTQQDRVAFMAECRAMAGSEIAVAERARRASSYPRTKDLVRERMKTALAVFKADNHTLKKSLRAMVGEQHDGLLVSAEDSGEYRVIDENSADDFERIFSFSALEAMWKECGKKGS